MGKSKIEWTDATWNPVLGCAKVSQGCKHCYAMRVAWRLQHNPKTATTYAGLAKMTSHGPEWTGRARFIPERLDQPLRWRKPRRVFVNSLSDLFHDDITDEQIAAVFTIMLQARQHVFQVLTKRPERMVQWVRGSVARKGLGEIYSIASSTLDVSIVPGAEALRKRRHIWLGTSVESREHVDRIDALRECPAAVRFLSCEPLLGSLGELDLSGIHWVIVGGESGPGARPMHPDWAREIRDQCVAQGVPFFFKQWGRWVPRDHPAAGHKLHGVRHSSPCSPVAYLARVGKKAAGRLLDGRTWDEMPDTRPPEA